MQRKRRLMAQMQLLGESVSTAMATSIGISLLGGHLRTLALKTESFSKKSVVLVKRENGFTKTLFSFFSRFSCPGDGFTKSIFAFY